MKLYYVSTVIGACLQAARDEDDAREIVIRRVGSYNGVKEVREATKADIAWVSGMGGYVPAKWRTSK